ncbi:MAG: N-acetylglucosamine-6-phosphate deacetylase [Nostocoides sp.]
MSPAADDSHASCMLRGQVVLPDRVIDDGVVIITGDELSWVGPAERVPATGELPPASADRILPGLVDLHNHGGGGVGFPDVRDAEAARAGAQEHLAHGTTTLLASLVTADRDSLLAQAELLSALVDAGDLGGIHAEGPFLSVDRCGAQSPDHLIPGDAGLVRELAAAAGGHLKTMTVAPEVPGVAGPGGAVEALLGVGALPSIGHTNCPMETAAAFLGKVNDHLGSARMTATHLFNAMPPMHHRHPGPVAACLAAARAGDLVVELIGDGVHLAPGMVSAVFDLVGPDGIVLVTDAMAAAGMADGDYELGPMAVRVAGGVARLRDQGDGGSIAGGTTHLLQVVAASVAAGVPLVAAVRSASWVPAGILSRSDIGALLSGRRADVVVVDAQWSARQVYRSGVRVH